MRPLLGLACFLLAIRGAFALWQDTTRAASKVCAIGGRVVEAVQRGAKHVGRWRHQRAELGMKLDREVQRNNATTIATLTGALGPLLAQLQTLQAQGQVKSAEPAAAAEEPKPKSEPASQGPSEDPDLADLVAQVAVIADPKPTSKRVPDTGLGRIGMSSPVEPMIKLAKRVPVPASAVTESSQALDALRKAAAKDPPVRRRGRLGFPIPRGPGWERRPGSKS